MATSFPGALDSFTNPSASDALDSATVGHAAQHANINDAVEALEAKVGADGSAVTSSLDYKVANQGLTLVKSQTIGSGVSSVTVTDAFSSTYKRYHVQFSQIQGSTYANLRFNFTSSTGLYYAALTGTVFNGSDRVAVTNGSSSYFDPIMQYSSAADAYGSFDIAAPYLASRTIVQGTEWGSDAGCSFGGVNTGSTSYTGFTITASTGTLSSGTIHIYGYNEG